MEHMALWNAIERTPTDQTKAITGKPYSGTSPKPYYLVRKATETFGPCGIGWGFTVVGERIEEGPAGEKLHIARVRVWYEWNGKRGEVEHIGATPFSGTRSNGKTYLDEDAPKKSVTDALVKALSMIGFAGDIFMGRYDDSKYVEELRAEERAEKKVATRDDPFSEKPTDKPKSDDFWGRPSLTFNKPSAEEWAKSFCAAAERAPSEALLIKLEADNKPHLQALPEALYNRCSDILSKRMGFWSQHPTGKVGEQ